MADREKPALKGKHDEEDIDSSELSVHHTIGTFRHQAAGGAHRHTRDDTSSLPLLQDVVYDASDPNGFYDILTRLGATVKNKPSDTWVNAQFVNGFSNYGANWVPAQFRKTQDGIVLVRGMIKNALALPTSGLTAFILPVGMRPKYRIMNITNGATPANAETLFSIEVEPTGEFMLGSPDGGATYVPAWVVCNLVFFGEA